MHVVCTICNLMRDSLWFWKFRNLIFIPYLKSKREINIYIQTLPLSPSFHLPHQLMRKWPHLVAYLYSFPIIQIPREKTGMTVKWGASPSLWALRQQPKDDALTHSGWFGGCHRYQLTFHRTHLPFPLSTQLDSLSASHTVSSDWRWILISGKRGEVTCAISGTCTHPPRVPTSPHTILSLFIWPAGSPHTGWFWKSCVEDVRDTR